MIRSILFVCLGNICRSPLAEGAMREEARRLRLPITVDSAGTGGWHRGDPPDRRAIEVARRHGVDISALRARKVEPEDFFQFDLVLALDHQNLRDLRGLRPADATARLALLLDHVEGRKGEAVADPYYGDLDDFETTWVDVALAARSLGRLIGGA